MTVSPESEHRNQWIGSSLAVAFIVLAIWRGRFHRRGEAPNITYFLLAGVVLVLLLYQESLDGMMVFGSSAVQTRLSAVAKKNRKSG